MEKENKTTVGKKNEVVKRNKHNEMEFQKALTVPTPRQLYEYLNEYVIGQDQAKKDLSVAVYNHYKRILANSSSLLPNDDTKQEFDELKDVRIDKSNVMLIGNTGTGKTYMIRKLAEYLGLPCYIADCSHLTESGYVGDDVESVLVGLLKASGNNVAFTQMGICCLDEIDKIARKGENTSITRDVSGEGVQQGLLKMVEGGKIGIPPQGGRKHPEQELLYIDTTNILFIGMGAFDGLERIVERRTNHRSIGYNVVNENEAKSDTLSNITSDDLVKFGIIPELIGRFPVITHTNELKKEDLVRIIKEPRNSILKQYQKLLLIDNVHLSFTDDAIEEVAETALKLKTGARGLRRIMEKILGEIMFEYGGMSGTNVTIDKEYIQGVFENSNQKKKVA